MKKAIGISEEEYARITVAVKRNKNKCVAKQLEVLILRKAGMNNMEISVRTGFNKRYITTLMGLYQKHCWTNTTRSSRRAIIGTCARAKKQKCWQNARGKQKPDKC